MFFVVVRFCRIGGFVIEVFVGGVCLGLPDILTVTTVVDISLGLTLWILSGLW